MIDVSGLTKVYDDLRLGPQTALDNFSFHADPGEVFGILGPNGAGKTTALRILCTLIKPTSGVARVNGFDVETQPELVRHQIGVIAANTAVYDRMTAWEMVDYCGRLHGIEPTELRERMEAVFARLRMDDIREVMGGKMSTGMKQKVAIARALVHDPQVLVFDEATNGLDVLVARNLLETIVELRDQGKCIVFSTHIMREVERLCTHVAIMHRGKKLAEGTLPELREQYREQDVEDIFFALVGRAEQAARAEEVA